MREGFVEFAGVSGAAAGTDGYGSVLIQCRIIPLETGTHRQILHSASAQRAMGECYRRLGLLDNALKHLGQAAQLYSEARDYANGSLSLYLQGNLYRQRGQWENAARSYRMSFLEAYAGRVEDRAAYSIAGSAETMRIKGDYGRASYLHSYLLREFSRLRNGRGIVWAYQGLAQMYRITGQLAEAGCLFDRTIDLSISLGDKRSLAFGYKGRGEVAVRSGDPGRAIADLSTAIAHFRDVNYLTGEAYGMKSMADALRFLRRYEESNQYYQRALSMFESIGDPRGGAFALGGLALLCADTQDLANGFNALRLARRVFQDHKIKYGIEVCRVADARLKQLRMRHSVFMT